MTPPSLAPTHALVGPAAWLEAASSGTANQIGQVDQGGGWLYHLLTKLGVSPDTASTVTDLIIRPLSILVVVVIALIVARLGARVIRRVLARVANQAANRSASQQAGARVTTMSGVLANVWRFFIFVVAGAIVLGLLGINLTPLLASATIIGATLGFGAQQIVRDYFSGVLMTMEDQYNVGDSITVGGVTGVVEDVTMRLTRFRGVDGTIYIVPNGDIRLVGNLSRGLGARRRGPDAAGCNGGGPRRGAAGHRGGGAPRGDGPDVRRALHRATTRGRPPRRRLFDNHAARHAADRSIATRCIDPRLARGGDHRAGQGAAVAGRRGAARRARALTDSPAGQVGRLAASAAVHMASSGGA